MTPAAGEDSVLVVMTTLGNDGDARSLVKHLVSERVVACGTIIEKARSLYVWKGELQEEPEVLVFLKTRRNRWGDLEKAVRELHPYEVPELLAMPVENGLPAYLEWLVGQTGEEAV